MALSISDTLSRNTPARSILSHTVQRQVPSGPRLFIVLPTSDTLTNALVDQFQLYYLCECGEHSRRVNKMNQHHGKDRASESHDVHLVDHEGYRIIDLPAFLEKYGMYTLELLRMVKYGASAGGMVVPRLLQFCGESQNEGGGQDTGRFEERVDFAINHIQWMLQGQDFNSARTPTFELTEDTPTSSSSDERNDIASWLQREMFDKLGMFLDGRDCGHDDNCSSDNTPGNLYRVSSVKEGHVRWICYTHYNDQYPAPTRRPILRAIQNNNGSFNERRGTAKVRLATTAHATDFYKTLPSSPFLQHIHIFLDWIAEPADLKGLVFTLQQSNLQQAELYVKASVGASSALYNNNHPSSRGRNRPMYRKLTEENFFQGQLKNREGLDVNVRRWPNTFQTSELLLGNHILIRREFPMLSELLHSASSHITTISILVDFSDLDALMDLVWPFVEPRKKVEKFTLSMKDGSFLIMDFKNDGATPYSINARIPKLDNLDDRNFPLEFITDLALTGPHTLSEVDILVPVLIACCTSLNNLSVVLVNTHEHGSRPIYARSDDSYFEIPQPITFSVFELSSIPTLSSVILVHSVRQHTTLNFPMTRLDLKNLEICEVAELKKILGMYPLVNMLILAVTDLDDSCDLVVPFIQSLNRDMTLRMEQNSGGNAIFQFQKQESDDSGSSVLDIQLQVDATSHFKNLSLDQVKTMTLLLQPSVSQHEQLQDIAQLCTSLETLEVCCSRTLSLLTFSAALVSACKTLRLTRSDTKNMYQFALPITNLDLAKNFVAVYKQPSDLEYFFKVNPALTTLSLTVNFVGKDMPLFLSAIKSLHGQHRLLTCTLKDELGSSASVAFAEDNTITSYSLRFNTLFKQEDLQAYDLSSITEFILDRPCPVTEQIDSFLQEIIKKCPCLESIDLHCGSSYLKSFFLLSTSLKSLKKCILRNSNAQVTPSMDLSETYLNLGSEILLPTLYPSLVQTLQARRTITGLKILVESTLEAYEFFANMLAISLPWLAEIKISQQTVGPKMVVSFANDDYDDCDDEGGEGYDGDGAFRVSSIVLDVRSFSQLQPSMYSLLSKLTFSGELKNWTREELDQIPLSSCENLSTLELKCPPSQFPRILCSMHEASLMHPTLRCLKLWDGSRDNILTGTHIDDLDAISIRLQQLRMVDFQTSLVELGALLKDYPLEIAHLELDTSFYVEQAEIIEKSLNLGNVRIRHIQWDISSTKDVRLFEIMLRAVSHCHDSVASGSNRSNKVVPTVAFKVANSSLRPSAPTIFDTSVSNNNANNGNNYNNYNSNNNQHQQQKWVLSTLGHLMTRFATSLILMNLGLELFLPDLLATELQSLQELEIRVNRYCPDNNFLCWLKSLMQRGIPSVVGQVSTRMGPEVKEMEIKAAEHEKTMALVTESMAAMKSEVSLVDFEDSDSDDYETDFVFDDPISSSIIFGDNASTPPPSTASPPYVMSLQSPITGALIHSATSPSATTATLTRQPLRRLTLHNLQFSTKQWKEFLESLDYLSLQSLSLERVGFSDIELIQLTKLYTKQVTRARKARSAAMVDGAGETEDDDKQEECVVRLFMTSVTKYEVDNELAFLKTNKCSQLKYVLV
ncbi:hypothetical protein BGZ96_005265 [Linnemannia gamsii]|uniref:Uncharacterized protein n=1 Tax=Linnemannia gamsii TaxID=64522 RepID=A0ABQ7K631_9FUNG|nr:hypothetical protein BGZ96_005265 [Linnemannia gamsii]